jgi:[ribosomal protein S5]-alanine N-acetyltransferase
MQLHSQRLALRPLTDNTADAAFIVELVNEPGWLANIGDRNIHTLDAARVYIANGPAASLARHGFGLLAVSLKSTGETIGLCGLIRRDTLEVPDLGYALLGRHQRQGYMLEAAQAVLDHADHALKLPRLLAIVKPGNHASITVLQKLGFTALGLRVMAAGEDSLLHFERRRP